MCSYCGSYCGSFEEKYLVFEKPSKGKSSLLVVVQMCMQLKRPGFEPTERFGNPV